MNKPDLYRVKSYDLFGLTGISDDTLRMHVGLYEGYVNAANALHAQLEEFRRGGRVDQEAMPAYSELRQTVWVLNTTAWCCTSTISGTSYREAAHVPAEESGFRRAVARTFGDFERWKADFAASGCCGCRVGPSAMSIRPAGCFPIIGSRSTNTATSPGFSRCWSWMCGNACLLDYKPGERMRYIDAFFQNVAWVPSKSVCRLDYPRCWFIDEGVHDETPLVYDVPRSIAP